MELLKRHLIRLITEKATVCCLCLKDEEENYFSIYDIVAFEYNKSNKETEVSKVLTYILGSECVQNLTTEMVCHSCLITSLKCFKFIAACKENADYFSVAIKRIKDSCDEAMQDPGAYKRIYLPTDESSETGCLFEYEKHSMNGKFIEKPKTTTKFNLGHQNESEQFSDTADTNDISMVEKRKINGRKHAEDLLNTVSISDILYDPNNLSLYKCKHCEKTFPRLHNLKRHFVRVHAPKDYLCSKCKKCFGSPAILEEHTLEIHSGKKVICAECGKKYSNIKSLKLHELSHKLNLKCGACGKIFHHQRSYHNHVTSKQCELVQKRRNAEKKYICDYCNKRYACKGTLKVHIQFEHGNRSHYICSWCGKKFCSLSKMKAHTVKHTREKNFNCQICGGWFVTKESLVYHTRRHTGEKPYECEHCNQRFLSTSRRADHIRRHHMVPSLECDICHSKFKGHSCLIRHKKRHFDPNSRLHYTKLANEV